MCVIQQGYQAETEGSARALGFVINCCYQLVEKLSIQSMAFDPSV